MSLQKKIFSQPTEVVELSIVTFVDLLEEPTMELVPPFIAIRASIFLRSSDVYDPPLQIFLQEPVLQDIGILICGLDFSEAELTCHATCI